MSTLLNKFRSLQTSFSLIKPSHIFSRSASAAAMSPNRAVYQEKAGVPGVIKENPTPSKLEDSKILVKVQAWAMNPADTLIQDVSLPFVQYPVILGQDVAGTVESTGPSVTKFKKGDRVFGASMNNGFQEYVQLEQELATKIPDAMSYKEAVVFPLGISTAACGLFDDNYIGLKSKPSTNSTSNGQSVLIWGGSSSVGSNAIQLAKAAGYKVITTCSPRSSDYVKSLGADVVFDYSSPSVTEDVAAELDKGTCAGIYMAAGKVPDVCKVSGASKQKPFVACTNPVNEGDAPEGVTAKFTFGTGGIEDFLPTAKYIWGSFLPDALAKGTYKVAPAPSVVSSQGIEGIQDGLDALKKGVSSTKVVVECH